MLRFNNMNCFVLRFLIYVITIIMFQAQTGFSSGTDASTLEQRAVLGKLRKLD